MENVVLKVKQGEVINVGFTIKQGGQPMLLTGYTVNFQVKSSPTVKNKPLVNKIITTTSDANTDGVINYPNLGQFYVHLNEKDTSLPIGDYYLIISIQRFNENNIISSTCCTTAKFIICEQ
jgi:hypothetical protein